MMEKVAYLREELAKAEAEEAKECRKEQMRQAAAQLRDYLDAMAEAGIPEEKAWKLILTSLKG